MDGAETAGRLIANWGFWGVVSQTFGIGLILLGGAL